MRSVFTRVSAAIDRASLPFLERRMTSGSPAIETRDGPAPLIALARTYSHGTLGVPSPFFPVPSPLTPTLTPVESSADQRVFDISWASAYEPFHPDARGPYLAAAENMIAHVRWWTTGGGRPTIIVLHGWGGGVPWITARMFVVPYWLQHGYDVAAFALPFHGPRSRPGVTSAFTPSWPSPNPIHTNEGFGHAIYDLRALSAFLRARGTPAIGVMGMSIGGYTAALWASLAGPTQPGGIDFAVAIAPAVSMSQLMWNHGKTTKIGKRAAKAGITEELLADAFAVHAPLTRPPVLPRDRLWVVAGRGDRITPPEQATTLAAHWNTDVRWFDGSHLAPVGRRDALRDLVRSLTTLDLHGAR